MKKEEARSAAVIVLSKLMFAQKLYTLALLSHNLTISVRWVHSEQFNNEKTLKKLYSINEIQHRLMSQMMHIALNEEIIPDNTFVNNLYSLAQQGKCEDELNTAIRQTLDVIRTKFDLTW